MNRKTGFNLIEIAIVLAVIGLVIGGIYVAASAVTERNRIQTTQKQFVTIMQNVRTLFATQPSFTVLNYAQVKATGIMPGDAIDTGSAFLNPYGGEIWIGDSSNNGTQAYTLWFIGISKQACLAIADNFLNNRSTTQMGFNINGTEYNVASPLTGEIPVGTLATQCASKTPSDFGVYSLIR